MKNKKKKISLIVPSFNEKDIIEKTIFDLVNSLNKNKIDYEIIIVDDNSKDGTIKLIHKLAKKNKKIKIIIRTQNPGFGFSLIEGTKKASEKIIVWVMSDLSDDFETIPKMIEKINQGFDIVIGSRNIKGGSSGDQHAIKAFSSRIYNFIARIFFKIPIYDITNAFRAFRKEVFSNIKLVRGDFAISPEFIIKAHLKGFKLGEVPITYKERQTGKAKMKLFKMGIIYYFLLLKYRFYKLFK